MSYYEFPSTFIYWESLKDHDELKAKYMPIIDKIERDHPEDLKNPYKDYCDVEFMSMDPEHKHKFLESDDITKIIWNPIDNFLKKMKSVTHIKESQLKNYWFNTYKYGDYQELHNHHDTPYVLNGKTYHPTFSGIYILNDENETSSIVFRNNAVSTLYDIYDAIVFNTANYNDIKEGTVIIFPHHLYHMVKKCTKPGRRTIAFNIFSDLQV